MVEDPRADLASRRSFGTDIITLVVGVDGERRFAVHRDLLCQHSAFFAAAVKKVWAEGHERMVRLPDDDPDTVDLYMHWLYMRKIFTRQPAEALTGSTLSSSEYLLLVNTFVFGEKIQDGQFKDAAIDAIIYAVNTPYHSGKRPHPPVGVIDHAYKLTPENSPLRQLFVDVYTYAGYRDWLENVKNSEFSADLARQLLDVRPKRTAQLHRLIDSACSYHQHGKDDPCYCKNGASERAK